jgi:hypothetical protein
VTPSVIGTVVDLGLCLDLTTQVGIEAVRSAHQGLVELHAITGKPLPTNTGLQRGSRNLDCAVINYLHQARKKIAPGVPYQTGRALFVEGGELYDGAGFHDRTHVQLCVIDQLQILGVFRLPKWQQKLLGIEQGLYL